MLRRSGAVDKFVDALVSVDAVLQDVDDGFVAKQVATFGVGDFSCVEKEDSVGFAGVDFAFLVILTRISYAPGNFNGRLSERRAGGLSKAGIFSALA